MNERYPLVKALLDTPAVITERFAAQLQGIVEDIGLLRIRRSRKYAQFTQHRMSNGFLGR